MKNRYARNIIIAGIWLGYWLVSAAVASENVVVAEADAQKSEAEAQQPAETQQPGSSMGQKINDATTTARIKSRLILNDYTDGLRINVDTVNHEVTLKGTVRSEAERSLAEEIARGTDGVLEVQNYLRIASRGDDPGSGEDQEDAEAP